MGELESYKLASKGIINFLKIILQNNSMVFEEHSK